MYKEIFLDGFTYNDKEAAEELIIRLSEAGVKIIISATPFRRIREPIHRHFLELPVMRLNSRMVIQR